MTSDIGQLAYQKDTQTFYRLQTTAPTWTHDATDGLIVKGAMTCTVTNISTAAMPNTFKAVFTWLPISGPRTGYELDYKPCGSSAAVTRTEFHQSMSAIRTSDI